MRFKKSLRIIIASFFIIFISFFIVNFIKQQKEIKYDKVLKLTNVYPHNIDSFTQGLFFHNDELYESVGEYGQSALYKNINLLNGKFQKKYNLFSNDVFAEGSVVFDGKLYVLTFLEKKVFVLNPETLNLLKEVSYTRQGWGLTTDGEYLISSDGTSNIYFMDKQLNDIKKITVKNDNKEVFNLNELEYIDGNIWANIWMTNKIVIIDKQNGNVIQTLNFDGLYNSKKKNIDDVMNGIAYNSKTKKVYITGKRWSKLYEFEFI